MRQCRTEAGPPMGVRLSKYGEEAGICVEIASLAEDTTAGVMHERGCKGVSVRWDTV